MKFKYLQPLSKCVWNRFNIYWHVFSGQSFLITRSTQSNSLSLYISLLHFHFSHCQPVLTPRTQIIQLKIPRKAFAHVMLNGGESVIWCTYYGHWCANLNRINDEHGQVKTYWMCKRDGLKMLVECDSFTRRDTPREKINEKFESRG